MKYILIRESFVNKKEVEEKPILKLIYKYVLENIKSGENLSNIIKNKKEDIIMWFSKAIFLEFSEYIRGEMDNMFVNKDEEFQIYKRYYDIIRLKVEDYNNTEILNIQGIFKKWLKSEGIEDKISYIEDYIFSPMRTTDWKLPLNKKLEDAYELSKKWHKNLKATGKIVDEKGDIIMEFPDGYYLIDLKSSECEEEGEAMGHCATTNADTLISLRSKRKEPHVTIAYNYDGIVKQIKGKNNEKPIEKYYPYIVKFIAKYVKDFDWEYEPEDDLRLKDLNEGEILFIYENNENIKKSREFISASLSKDINIDNIDYSKMYVDLIKKEDKVYCKYNREDDLLELFYDDNYGENYLSHDVIKDVFNGMTYEYFIDTHSDISLFFLYGYPFEDNKGMSMIVKSLKEIDNLKNVKYNEEDNYISIDGVKLENYEYLEILDTYNIIRTAYNDQIRNSAGAELIDSVYDSLSEKYNIDFKNRLIYVDKHMLGFAFEVEDEMGSEEFLNNYIYYINEYSVDELIKVSKPYYGYQGEFKEKYYLEILKQIIEEEIGLRNI